ncbi:MAG TPA: hypothetical protein VGY96_06045 [Streptosporangiaceae bacterium]|jgi:hypothetical protein|nr:hypothetical protein [Streptosporangiaceae bacterium]
MSTVLRRPSLADHQDPVMTGHLAGGEPGVVMTAPKTGRFS